MGFFEDFNAAVETYPDTSMSLEILNVHFPGHRLNVMEDGNFEVLIRNDGPLRVRDLVLRIRGLDGVLVKDVDTEQLETEIELANDIVVEPMGGTFLIAPASADWSQALEFRTPTSPLSRRDLIEASIMNWAVDLNVLTASHGWSAAATTYVDRVRAA